MQNLKPLASLYSRAGQFESYLVANPKDRFSRDEAQLGLKKKKTCVSTYPTNPTF